MSTTPPPDPTAPDPPAPPGTGDTVLEIHRRHMAEMNEAALTFDGTPPDAEPDEERDDAVRRTLDVLAREHAEPRDGFEPVPFWVACVFGGLLAWGGYYVGGSTADFRPDVFDGADLATPAGGPAAPAAPDPDPQTVAELMKIGEQKYAVCAQCHRPDGKGEAQKVPPLAGSEWVAGDQASAARLSRILLYGLEGPVTVKGEGYFGQMPAQGGVMKDYEIAAVITYVRNSWGNKADADKPPAVTAAVVRAARAADGKRKPYTAPELLALKDPPKEPKKDEPKADPIPTAKE